MAEQKVAELIDELNSFAESRFSQGNFDEAEERYRAALDLYREWSQIPANRLTAILTTITGLVKTLEAQGRQKEAAELLEKEEPTITSIVTMLRDHIK